jgi:hypothetical protein
VFLPKRSQSILEYAVLIAVAAATLLIMQTFMKRGLSGRIKTSSDQISGGENFSAGSTTILQDRAMTTDRDIVEFTATVSGSPLNTLAGDLVDSSSPISSVESTLDSNAYSATATSGGRMRSTSLTKTGSLSEEQFRAGDYQDDAVDDFGSDAFTETSDEFFGDKN